MATLESSFLNLNRGNRLSAYLGLILEPGFEPTPFAKGYTYIDIPVLSLWKGDSAARERVDTGLRNQHIWIQPACTIDPKGDYKVLVEPNVALAEFGSVQASYYIQPETGRQVPGFYISLRRDLDLTGIQYAVRLYMRI